MKTWDFLPELAICATMSAGKSTFLNALLGVNYIPSSNLACTAKISSFLNCNELEKGFILGATRMKDGRIIEDVATSDALSSWNSDEDVEQIYLVGSFQNISIPLVIHDTPGTNSAINPIHRDMTQNFLLDNPPFLLAFVINAENNGSNDETYFLSWLKKNLVDKHGTEVIFILNKMDSPDFEREDFLGFMQDTRAGLIRLGFKRPIIFPVSADAALLFRMLLNQQEFTDFESIRLASYYSYFLNGNFSLAEGNLQPEENFSADVINFCGEDYRIENLLKAIRRTGICNIEEYITEKFKIRHLKFFPDIP